MKTQCSNPGIPPELNEPPDALPCAAHPIPEQTEEEHARYCAECIEFYTHRYNEILLAKGVTLADTYLHGCPLNELGKGTRGKIFRTVQSIKEHYAEID